jgi:hypothetical protein
VAGVVAGGAGAVAVGAGRLVAVAVGVAALVVGCSWPPRRIAIAATTIPSSSNPATKSARVSKRPRSRRIARR